MGSDQRFPVRRLGVEFLDGFMDIEAGQAVITEPGEWVRWDLLAVDLSSEDGETHWP